MVISYDTARTGKKLYPISSYFKGTKGNGKRKNLREETITPTHFEWCLPRNTKQNLLAFSLLQSSFPQNWLKMSGKIKA
jgi:hypothetical protein